MTITNTKNSVVIDNGIYQAILSLSHGGTLRKLVYRGIDTKLKREGCEFWELKKKHYEQEYGKCLDYMYERNEYFCYVSIEAELRCPATKELGGSCVVNWIFNDSPIIESISRINPNSRIHRDDKYVCFEPNFYTEYCHFKNKIKFKKIQTLPIKYVVENKKSVYWTRDNVNNTKTAIVKNDKIGVAFMPDQRLVDTGVYNSISMLEIKSQAKYIKPSLTLTRIIPFIKLPELEGVINGNE